MSIELTIGGGAIALFFVVLIALRLIDDDPHPRPMRERLLSARMQAVREGLSASD